MGVLGLAGAAVAVGSAGGLGVVAHGAFHPRARLFCPVRWHGAPERPEVALTFDDGPTPGLTDAILDVLGEAGAPASFFVIGRHAERRPELVRRVHEAGHLVGNHTLDHHRHGLFHRDAYWHEQVAGCGRVVEGIIGVRPRLFRPPMGFTSAHIARAVRAEGCAVVTWSRRGLDTGRRPAASIARRVLDGLSPGEVVALHDGIDGDRREPASATPEAVRLVLEELRRRDLRPVRLDTLLELEAYAGSRSGSATGSGRPTSRAARDASP